MKTMKQLLLLSLFSPLVASAQIEISALGGASFNAGTYKYAYAKYVNNIDVKRTNIMPYGSFKIAYLYKGFSFGLSADVVSIKQSIYPGGWSFDPKTNKSVGIDYILKPYNPGLNISIFANRIIEKSKSAIYFGLNAGYIFSLSSGSGFAKVDDPTIELPVVAEMNGSSNGITFGIQAGYTYSLTDRLKLKAEFAPRYLYSLKAFGEKDNQHVYNTIILPVGIGVSIML